MKDKYGNTPLYLSCVKSSEEMKPKNNILK